MSTPSFEQALQKMLEAALPGQRVCEETGELFDITAEDIERCKRFQTLLPTTSFHARIRRLRSFVAGFDLFRRTLPDGRVVISMYDPESSVPLLPQAEWYAARADGRLGEEYTHVYTPDRSFFDQWTEFSRRVPRPAIFQDPQNERCDWVVYTFGSKDCYQTFGGGMNEHVLYSEQGVQCKHASDLTLCDETEWSYDCVHCPNCSHTFYSQQCERCVNVSFSLGCVSCRDCFGCTNLKGKQFCFLNEQLTEEAYRQRLSEVDLRDASVVDLWREKIQTECWDKAVRRTGYTPGSERANGDDLHDSRDVSGISLYQCERVYDSFAAMESKDSYVISSAIAEQSLNSTYIKRAYGNRMCLSSDGCIDIEYSESLDGCEHCFACIGLSRKKFCLFNVQYTEEEYWKRVDQIKTDMVKRGEYGQFFPYSASPFAYNTAHSDTFAPLTQEEVSRLGGRWYAFPDAQVEALSIDDLPLKLQQTTDAVLQNAYRCPVSGRAFRYVKPELELHRMLGVALPRIHPTIRRKARMRKDGAIRLWSRTCEECQLPVQARSAPGSAGRILCTECFEQMRLAT